MTFEMVWIIYAICGTIVLCSVFAWAVRSGQFSDLNRPRYTALTAGDPLETEQPARTPGRIDRYTWLALVLMTLAALAVAVYTGARGG